MAYSPLRPQGDTFDSTDAIRQNIGAEQDVLRAVLSTSQGISAGDLASRALDLEYNKDPNWEAARDSYLRSQRKTQDLAPRVTSLRDIGGVGDAIDFAQQGFASGVTSTLPSLAAAMALRGKAGYVGAAVPGYMMSRGEIAGNQYSDPALAMTPVEDRAYAASTGALVSGALESVVPGGLAATAFRKPVGSFAGNVMRDGLSEAATEAAQTGAEHLAAKHLDPTQALDPMALADAAATGFLGGGGLSAATRAPAHLAGMVPTPQPAAPGAEPAPAALGLDGGAQQAGAPAGGPIVPSGPADAAPAQNYDIDPNAPRLAGNEFGGEYTEVDSTPASTLSDDLKVKAAGAAAYVNDKLSKAKEAYATSGSAADFVNSIFGGIGEDLANLARGPDDASLAGATPEETIQNINANDLARTQSAQRVAEALMADESIPSLFRDRIVNLNGDYSSTVSQQYIHSLANGKRVAMQMADALAGLGKLADKATSSLGEKLKSGSKRSNLQNFNEADIRPLVAALSEKLGPAAADKAPELARQLLAVSSRLSFGYDGDFTQGDHHLRNLSEVVDDKTLDLITEMTGNNALRNAVVKTREIPNAENDLRASGGNSFLESMLVERNISPTIKAGLAQFVDATSKGIKQMNPTVKSNTLNALAQAFGSPERAQTVLEYYGNLSRDAALRETDASKSAPREDRPADGVERPEFQIEQSTPDGTVEWGELTEKDGRTFQYGFRMGGTKLPFRKFGRATKDNLTEGRIALKAAKGRSANSDSHLVPYSEYLDDAGVDHGYGVKEMGASIKKRIADHKAEAERAKKKGDKAEVANREKQVLELRGELALLEHMAKTTSPKQALDMYEVLRHGERSSEDRVDIANDDEIADMQVSAKKHPDSVLTFLKTNGKTLKLSAISMIAHQGIKRRDSRAIVSPTKSTDEEQLYAAIASVLDRDDIVELQTPLGENVQIRDMEGEGRTLKAAAPKLKAKGEWSGKRTPRKKRFEVNPLRQEAEAAYAAEVDVEYDPEADNVLEADLNSEPSDEPQLDPKKSIGGYEELIDLYMSRVEQAVDSMELGGRNVGRDARSAEELVEELDSLATEANSRSNQAEADMTAAKEAASASFTKKGSKEWAAYYAAAGKFDFERQRAWEFESAHKRADRMLQSRERELSEDTATGAGGEAAAFADAAERRESNTAIERGAADANVGLKKQPTMKTDAVLEANPELLTVLDSTGAPKNPSWSMTKTRERLINAYKALESEELLARRDAVRKRLDGKEKGSVNAKTLDLLDQIITNILNSRGINSKRTTSGLARLEKLVAEDKAVKRDGVYYITNAAATKRVVGSTADGYIYVNLAKLKEGGLLKALKASPQKLKSIERLGVTPEQFAGLFENVRREASFLRDYEKYRQRMFKVTEGKDAFPLTKDGMYDTEHKTAIRLDSQALTDALTKQEFEKLVAQSIVNKKLAAKQKKGDKAAIAAAEKHEVKRRAVEDGSLRHTFVGTKADPEGARQARAALNKAAKTMGKQAANDFVWSTLGWFRGPDGKLRKEIRSPALKKRLREALKRLVQGHDINVTAILNGVPGFEKLAPLFKGYKFTADIGMSAFMGAQGAFDPTDKTVGFSETGVSKAVLIDMLEETVGAQKAIDTHLGEMQQQGIDFDDVTAMLKFFHAKGALYFNQRAFDERVKDRIVSTLLHELQHAIQSVEGFEGGGNPQTAVVAMYGNPEAMRKAMADKDEDALEAMLDGALSAMRAELGDGDLEKAAHELYKRIVGEAEAHDVQDRLKLTDEQAKSIRPDLLDGSKQFVKSTVAAAYSLQFSKLRANRQSSQTPNTGAAPARDRAEEARIEAELLKMLGPRLKVKFKQFFGPDGSGSYRWSERYQKHIIKIATNAGDMNGVAMHEALHAFFRALGQDANTRTLRRDLMAAASTPYAMKKLRELLRGHPEAIKQIEGDMEERAAYMFQFWQAGMMPELGQTGQNFFQRLFKMITEVLGLASKDERAVEIMSKLAAGEFSDMSIVKEVMQDMKAKTLTNRLEAMAPSLVHTARKLYRMGPDRLRDFSVPELAKLAEEFSSETGKLGFIQRRFKQNGAWQNRLADILEGTTATERRRLIDKFQSMQPPTTQREQDLAKYFEDLYDYMDKAGVKRFDPATKRWVPVNRLGRYFPRAWDADYIRNHRAAWEQLLTSHNVSQEQIKKVTDAIIKGDGHLDLAEGPGHMGFTPFAAGVQNRQFTFINQANAATFAAFQKKDLADVVMAYTHQAVHRAEYARSFGNNGEDIAKAVRASRLSPKDEAEAMNVIRGLEGTLDGNGLSQDTKSAMSWVMTTQNTILLPLAIFSQMIDPIVLAARSGNLKDAGHAYVTAVKRIFQKHPDYAERMTKMLGIISADATLEAMGMSYGSSYMSPGAQKINRAFFKYNGMQHWNDSMRIAAFTAGEGYMIDNRTNKTALAELGLKPRDIQFRNDRVLLTADALAAAAGRPKTPDDEAQATRLQEAMFRFVDSAVIRPSASQRPTWMSDPRFMLIAHLKQFTFAMHNVVLKRAAHEMDYNENVKPSAILLLTIPTILAADLIKMAFTGAPPNWTYMDYLNHAVQRSGLLGLGDFTASLPTDVERGKAPGEGLLGPSVEHLLKILRWALGDPRTSLGDVIDRTVPGARYV